MFVFVRWVVVDIRVDAFCLDMLARILHAKYESLYVFTDGHGGTSLGRLG